MLPSKGLFKEESCPLFDEGLCERPYCHFRHKKPDINSEQFNIIIANLDKVIEKLPIFREPQLNSNSDVKPVNCNVKSNAKDLAVSSDIPSKGSIINPSSDSHLLTAQETAQNKSEKCPEISKELGAACDDTKANIVVAPNSSNCESQPTVGNALNKIENSPELETMKDIDDTVDKNLDEVTDVYKSNGKPEVKLTKEQLHNIDEIVNLLKDFPEHINFVTKFIKSYVSNEDNTSSSKSASRHRSSRSHSHHSSKSHKSSHSSRDSDRKGRNDRHHKSSNNDKRDHGHQKTEKRKRDEDGKHEEPVKKSKRDGNEDEAKPIFNEPGSDLDSDTCDDFASAFNEVETNDDDDGVPKRLSVEEELEKMHDDDDPNGCQVSVSSKGKRRVAHDTPYISDHKMLRAKVGRTVSAPMVRPSERIAPPIPTGDSSCIDYRAASTSNKPRIAAVTNFQRLIAEKTNLATTVNRLSTPTPTVVKSVAHGAKRIEHKSDIKDVLCPTVSEGSRTVASTTRNLSLKRLFTAFQYLPSKNEAREMALKIEGQIFQEHKDSSKKYHMATVNAIMKAKRGYSKEKRTGPTEEEFYEMVQPHLLTDEQLNQNGFPIDIGDGYASCTLSQEFKYNKKYKFIKDAFSKGERYCVRCSMTYKVDDTTWEQTPIPDVCVFHADNGKRRVLGEVTHKCCAAPGPGCMSESLHITDLKDYDRLPGCVKSMPKSSPEKYRKVLALDCEMVHTRLGVELAYIVVVDSSCRVVYESYCKPSREVECYNTTYSGITEEKLRNVKKTLITIQKEFLELISDETILVGHSLDSDFRALHLIHGMVADTAFIFRVESPDGSFYKRRLKELAQSYLGKIIQESEYGHSAEEDASAAMGLLRHRVLSM